MYKECELGVNKTYEEVMGGFLPALADYYAHPENYNIEPFQIFGNLYYVDNALIFLNRKKKPSKRFMQIFYLFAIFIIFIGAIIPMDAAWAMADITMGGMTLINLPVCILLGKYAFDCLKDYEKQKKAGENPVFKGSNIGIDEELIDTWK